MSKRDVAVTLRQIIEFADEIAALIANRSRDQLNSTKEFRRALERCIELVCEAARRLPEEWREHHQDIPWRQIIGMRNVMIHGYDVVSNDVLWNTAAHDMPQLRAKIESILVNEA